MNLVSSVFMLPYLKGNKHVHPIATFSRSFSAAVQLMPDFQKGRMTPEGQLPPFKISVCSCAREFWFIFSLLNYNELLQYQCLSGHSNTSNQAFCGHPLCPEGTENVYKKSGLIEPHAASHLSSSDRDDPTQNTLLSVIPHCQTLPTPTKPSVYDLELLHQPLLTKGSGLSTGVIYSFA